MPADYHTHTPLCLHAEGTPEAYIDTAIAAGLTEYGISDHNPAHPEPYDDWRMLESDLPAYFSWIDRARDHAAGRIPVRAGMECDWWPGCESWIEDLAGRYAWDYLIGSIHYLGEGWDFDNPKWLGRWAESDVDEVWTRYWNEYAAMARSGLFDILGHPDLIKKFAFRPEGDLNHFYEPVIDAIAASGSVIEINTNGWNKPCAEQYPAESFIRLACEAGIPLVISSDAHAPSEPGRDFDKATAIAIANGYTHTTLIDQHKRTSEAL